MEKRKGKGKKKWYWNLNRSKEQNWQFQFFFENLRTRRKNNKEKKEKEKLKIASLSTTIWRRGNDKQNSREHVKGRIGSEKEEGNRNWNLVDPRRFRGGATSVRGNRSRWQVSFGGSNFFPNFLPSLSLLISTAFCSSKR